MYFRKRNRKNQQRVGIKKSPWVDLKQECYKFSKELASKHFLLEKKKKKLSSINRVIQQIRSMREWNDVGKLLFNRKVSQLMH